MSKSIQHIIISRSDNIGDVILTLPLATAIKAAWPHCQITVLARAYVQDVVAAHAAVDHFIDWAQLDQLPEAAAVAKLESLAVDAILHVFPRPKIAKLAYRAGIRRRIGTNRRWYHWLYCNRWCNFSRKQSPLHEVQLNMILLRALKLPDRYELSTLVPMVKLSPQPLSNKLQAVVDPARFSLLLHPLSHGHGREWPLSHFTSLSKLLDPERYQILVTGSAAEAERLKDSELLQLPQVTSLCGQLSLAELLSLLNAVDGVVASGTGPLHMAAACGSRTLGLFPKKPGIGLQRWRPVGAQAQGMTCLEACAGCSSSEDCACMRLLQVQQVMAIVRQWQQTWRPLSDEYAGE